MENHQAALVVIDFQERLVPAMPDPTLLLSRAAILAKGFAILEQPILVTEQYPRGLGHTVPEVQAAVGTAAVFEKTSFPATGSEEFLKALEEISPQTVYLCGIEAHICVLQTAEALQKRGYRVELVVDAMASRKSVDYDIALRRAVQEGIALTTVEAVLFRLIGGKEHPHFKEISKLIQ